MKKVSKLSKSILLGDFSILSVIEMLKTEIIQLNKENYHDKMELASFSGWKHRLSELHV